MSPESAESLEVERLLALRGREFAEEAWARTAPLLAVVVSTGDEVKSEDTAGDADEAPIVAAPPAAAASAAALALARLAICISRLGR